MHHNRCAVYRIENANRAIQDYQKAPGDFLNHSDVTKGADAEKSRDKNARVVHVGRGYRSEPAVYTLLSES